MQLAKGKGGNSAATLAPTVEVSEDELAATAGGGEGCEVANKEMDGVGDVNNSALEPSSLPEQGLPEIPEPKDSICEEIPATPEMSGMKTPDKPTRRGYRSPSPSPCPSQPEPTLPANELEVEIFKATLPRRPVAAPLRGGGLEPTGDAPKEVDEDPYWDVASADPYNCDFCDS